MCIYFSTKAIYILCKSWYTIIVLDMLTPKTNNFVEEPSVKKLVEALQLVDALMRTGRKVTAEVTKEEKTIVSCKINEETETAQTFVCVLVGNNGDVWDVFICPCEDFDASNLDCDCAMQIGHNMKSNQVLEVLKKL